MRTQPCKRKIFTIKRLISLGLILILAIRGNGQNSFKSLTAKFITEDIILDGVLDENAWQEAEATDFFWQYFPTDSVKTKTETHVKVMYNDKFLYVAFYASSTGGDYVVSTLKRDFGGTTNDNVSLLFDTFNDGTNAFFFGITPYGVRREGLVSDGGTAFNNTWDIKWQAESKMYDDHYVVEIAIPFNSLKFKEGDTKWRFRPYRWNLQTNEQSTWVRVPQNQIFSSLAYMGELIFEKPLGKFRTPFGLIPYTNAIVSKDYQANISEEHISFGGDAKVAVGTGMNLDLTVNPDFSNVEVDDIFTNLTRFELFLPEKRQFFIDNNDLFASFGSRRDAIPFFSRRIGLARDINGNLIENRIIGGARLSGKLDQNWRLGLLNIQTDGDEPNEIVSNNNTMIAVQRKVFSRSNIGAFIVNRETFGDYTFLENEDKYNRVMGIDYNMASEDNTWTGKFYLHKSFQPNNNKGNFSSQANLVYNSRNWRFSSDFVYVDAEFTSDLGFVPRRDLFKTGQSIARMFYPSGGSISNHNLRILILNFWRPNLDFKKSDHNYQIEWEVAFNNQSTFQTEVSNQYIFLTNDFDPTRTEGGVPIPGDQGYTFNQLELEYQSSPTNLLTFSGNSTLGQFFNGNRYSFGGMLGLRFQPKVQLSLALNYDGIRLPDPYPDANLWLLTSRMDITFSKSVFWSTLIQYSNQRENLGLNSRLQWRFAPLSDLYLVYNDNYITSDFSSRFRSINLKFTYWLNI